MKKSLLTLLFCSIVILGACSHTNESHTDKKLETTVKKVKTSVSTTVSDETSEKNVSRFHSKDYLTIDPTIVSEYSDGPYTLSPLVKSVVGSYEGTTQDGLSDDYLYNYQLRIKEDGTYVKLTRKLTLILDSMTNFSLFERIYFDSSQTMKWARPTISINGKTYSYSEDYIYERGVLVEKFGKLHFAPLAQYDTEAIDHHSVFIEANGQVNLAKDLVASFVDLDNLPDLETGFEQLVQTKFDYQKEFQFAETSEYILDGKIMINNLQLTKTDKVDTLVSTDLDQLITAEVVKSIFSDMNGILQIVAIQKGIYQVNEPQLVPFTDHTKIYNSDGSNAGVIYALLDETSKDLYVYQRGKLLTAQEMNSTYVLSE